VTAREPCVGARRVAVYLIRWIGRRSPTPQHPRVRRDLCQRERDCSCFACTPGYVRNADNEISYRIVPKGIIGINERGAVPVAAANGVDARWRESISSGGYKATRDRQHRVLQRPHVRGGSKFPNLVSHSGVDPKPAQDVELIVVNREAARQSHPVTIARPRSSNRVDRVGDRVITENAGCGSVLSACRAAYAIDVRCSRVGEHAASHVADLIVGICGRLDSPSVGHRIIFKWVREIVADSIHAAPAHRVELVVEIGIEIDANHPDTGTRHVWTCRPAPVTDCRLRGLGLVGSWFLRWALSPLAQC
jgi:hypothetical protein